MSEEGGGSSPLTRGKLFGHFHDQEPAGLIPAHAGKTRRRAGAAPGERAHPRSRGENLVVCATTFVASGSSPLTRGKPMPRANTLSDLGLIPAHAGKTRMGRALARWLGAHPRSRGENWLQGQPPCVI